jgi:hypothetical protein
MCGVIPTLVLRLNGTKFWEQTALTLQWDQFVKSRNSIGVGVRKQKAVREICRRCDGHCEACCLPGCDAV